MTSLTTDARARFIGVKEHVYMFETCKGVRQEDALEVAENLLVAAAEQLKELLHEPSVSQKVVLIQLAIDAASAALYSARNAEPEVQP